MLIRKLRLRKAWSQEQLAEMSGLSVRTIQRIERGQDASLETLKALSAVFEIDLSELQQETDEMGPEQKLSIEEAKALEYVRDIKGFYAHLFTYAVVVPIVFIFNYQFMPQHIWAWWMMLGWGAGLASHGLSVYEVFNLFGPNWERRQLEKRLGRKL